MQKEYVRARGSSACKTDPTYLFCASKCWLTLNPKSSFRTESYNAQKNSCPPIGRHHPTQLRATVARLFTLMRARLASLDHNFRDLRPLFADVAYGRER